MKILAISGYKEQGKTLIASLIGGYLENKKYINLSYYGILEQLVFSSNEEERNASIHLIQYSVPNFFIDSIKAKLALWQGIYDYMIVDDIESESVMQQVKIELNAVLIGVTKDYPYSLPYTVRGILTTDIMGSPDIIIKNNMTIFGIQTALKNAIEEMKQKNLI